MIRLISEIVDPPPRDLIYEVLRYAAPRLAVDIGAGSGVITRKLHQLDPDKTRVVAFEPFPGNIIHFKTNVSTLPNIRLIQKAVSDHVGTARFFVPSTVQGSEPAGEGRVGYSSVGFLTDRFTSNRFSGLSRLARRVLKVLKRDRRGHMLSVDTTTIDMELPTETIGFMKIDVQGAEGKVLRGTMGKLGRREVDLLYVEWSGDEAVVNLLLENQYRIYDSTYVAGARSPDRAPFERIGFRYLSQIHLTTGDVAFEFYLPAGGPSPSEAIKAVLRQKLGWIQTDLIAVSPKSLSMFSSAMSQYLREGV